MGRISEFGTTVAGMISLVRGMDIGIRKAEIRKAVAEDISSVARIERETSAIPWSRESLAFDITDNDRAFVAVITVADPDDLVIGYADMWMIAGEAQLNNIAVDEKSRGNHYGGRLLKYMIDEAARHECDIMTLEVRTGNVAAIAMYKNAGFTEDGIRRNYYQDNDEDALLLSLKL